MPDKKQLAKLTYKPRQITRGVIKTVAGMALTDPRELVQLAAHAGDGLLKGEFSRTLCDTYAYFINKGKIDPKYFDTTKFADLSPEFGQVRDSEYGVYKLDQIRKMFVNLALDNGENSHKKYLLDIAMRLSEPEIKVLLADYHLATVEEPKFENNFFRKAENWLPCIRVTSGLRHNDLINIAWGKLIDEGLVRKPVAANNIDFVPHTGSLTTMGFELCELTMLDDDPVQ